MKNGPTLVWRLPGPTNILFVTHLYTLLGERGSKLVIKDNSCKYVDTFNRFNNIFEPAGVNTKVLIDAAYLGFPQ